MRGAWRRWSSSCARLCRAAAGPRPHLLHNEAHPAQQQQARQASEELRGTSTSTTTSSSSNSAMDLFDRSQKRAHRDRAAACRMDGDPLLATITDRLLDRLEDCVAKFPTAVVLGGAGDVVAQRLVGGRAGIDHVIHIDASQQMLLRAKALRERHLAQQEGDSSSGGGSGGGSWPRTTYVQGHEEELPLEPSSVDLIVSCLGLHWANDLPGALAQCRLALKPDGLFLAAMFGGETLQELRIACAAAQLEREGGVSPWVSPLAQVRDAGNLLTRAGFALPTVDVDTFELQYPSALELVEHLRAQGESSALLVKRGGALRRDQALAAAAAYEGLFRGEGPGGCVPATYQVMFMTGWSPARNQPRAAARGSATISFADFVDQIGAGSGGSSGS